MTFRAKKNLGQHFLSNQAVCKRIVNSCNLSNEDMVLEIGPGQGAITSFLAQQVKHVYAVDTDQRSIDYLKETLTNENIDLIKDDILRYPIETLPSPIKVVSNLPYNIASPVIEKLLINKSKITEIYIMVQLEYGQRITAKPGGKDYGAFSCFVQYHADTKMLFKIPPSAFRPAPKVQSCFLKLMTTPKHGLKAEDESYLFKVIKQAFQQRRKTIVNSLGILIDKEKLIPVLKKIGIGLQDRAERITLEQYVYLANETKKLGIQLEYR